MKIRTNRIDSESCLSQIFGEGLRSWISQIFGEGLRSWISQIFGEGLRSLISQIIGEGLNHGKLSSLEKDKDHG